MNPFAELFSPMDEDEAPSAPRPLPEAQVATLRETFARYAAGCPFKPGDLVTPRPGLNVKNSGEPMIVLEVLDAPLRPAEGDHGEQGFYARLDMRTAALMESRAEGFSCIAHWQESWMFEPYALPTAELAAA